jgi:hypothetical protein
VSVCAPVYVACIQIPLCVFVHVKMYVCFSAGWPGKVDIRGHQPAWSLDIAAAVLLGLGVKVRYRLGSSGQTRDCTLGRDVVHG